MKLILAVSVLEYQIIDYCNLSLEEVIYEVTKIDPEMVQYPSLLKNYRSVLRDESTGEELHNFVSLWEYIRSCK